MLRVLRPGYLWAASLVALSLVTACSSPDGSGNKERPGSDGRKPSTTQKASIFDKKLTLVGLKKGQPGFSTKSSEGDTFTGFEKDLVSYLADRIGFEPDYRDIPSLRREKILRGGSADLIVATYSITPQRDEQVDFTAPYLKTYQGLLVRDGDDSIKKLKDVEGKRVCTAYGSTSDPGSVRKKEEKAAIEKALGESIKPGFRNNYKSCVQEIKRGNFDALWTDKILLEGFEEAYDGVHVVENITVQSPQLYGVGLREGQEEDCLRLNKALGKFVNSHAWRDTFKSHFPGVVADHKETFEAMYNPRDTDFDEEAKASCGASD